MRSQRFTDVTPKVSRRRISWRPGCCWKVWPLSAHPGRRTRWRVSRYRRILRAVLGTLMLFCITASVARAQNRDAVPTSRDSGLVRIPLIDQQDIRFKRLSTVDGLSQTMVTSILQDDQGFIWFGTQYGLNRYDGYKFKVFKHDPGLPDSLSGVYIHALFKDRSGKIWISNDQFRGPIRSDNRDVYSLSCRSPRSEGAVG